MVYKLGSTDRFESASVSKDLGCRYRGSNGGTRHPGPVGRELSAADVI